jgi:hypothetical protein
MVMRMHWVLIVLLSALVTACSSMPGSGLFRSGHGIGVVEATIGEPRFFRGDGQFTVETGVTVQVQDSVITGPNDRIRLRMIDGTRITLGGGSEFVFHVYSFVQPSPIARMSFSQGTLRIDIDRFTERQGARFEVATPLADIRVRGADFWAGDLFKDNQLDLVLLGEGVVTVTNGYGNVEIVEATHGTTVNFGAAPINPEPWPPEEIEDVTASISMRELPSE